MPELAEVEFYRKRWHQAAVGETVVAVLTHDTKKLLRELDLPAFRRALIHRAQREHGQQQRGAQVHGALACMVSKASWHCAADL